MKSMLTEDNSLRNRDALPLANIKVVELAQVLAGPFAGAILADMGADVIKVERPQGGDDSRMMGRPFKRGDALNFHEYNRGKRSVTLDLKSAEGIEGLHALLADADVFVHNMRPGVVEDLGISSEILCEQYPRLIYCEISAYGHSGPMRRLPSYEALVEAYSGLFSINGGPTEAPSRLGVSVCDLGSGMWAVIAILGLIHRRSVTGCGGVATTSLLETALVWAGQKIDSIFNENRDPERHASGTNTFAPYQSFDTNDGAIVICAGNDRLFKKIAQGLGHPEWASDERFKTNRLRVENKEALIQLMTPILAAGSQEYWTKTLQLAGAPCTPILSLRQASAETQVSNLKLRQPVCGDDFSLVGLPISFDGSRPPIRRPAPILGEHNGQTFEN